MFFRVEADLSFATEGEARAFHRACLLTLPKSSVINRGTPAQESGFIRLQKCYHDQDPSKDCVELDYQAKAP